jgi:hypothetical protein
MIHFKNENTKGPPIYRLTVTFIKKNFWGNVLGSSAKGISSIKYDFSESKISKFEIPIIIDEEIFRLKVSIDNIHAMHIIKN